MLNLIPAFLLMVAVPAFAATVRVDMVDGHQFSPARIQIKKGDTVEWVNTTKVNHTVTTDVSLVKDKTSVVVPAGAEAFHSGAVTPGSVFRYTFEVAGNYQYVCLPHEKHMRGAVEVAAE